MVARNDLNEATHEIETALRQLPGAAEHVRVLATNLGKIYAFVGSDLFSDLGPGERQEKVWTYLRKNVDSKALQYLVRVEPMNPEEFADFMRDTERRVLFSHWDLDAEGNE